MSTTITPNRTIKIRCSTLPEYPDCPRRCATQIIKQILQEMGYEFPQPARVISGCVGDAFHACQAFALREKSAGRIPSISTSIEAGMAEFQKRTADGVEYDDSTTNRNAAEQQVKIMAGAFFEDVLPALNPGFDVAGNPLIEYYREAQLQTPGFVLTGHMDVETAEHDIGDLKTGKSGHTYHAQLGGYSLLKKSTDGESARGLFIEHAPRPSLRRPYHGIERYVYKLQACENAAYYGCKHIIRDVQNFLANQSPWSFQVNPKSDLCGPKYCAAYGTPWCEITKPNS